MKEGKTGLRVVFFAVLFGLMYSVSAHAQSPGKELSDGETSEVKVLTAKPVFERKLDVLKLALPERKLELKILTAEPIPERKLDLKTLTPGSILERKLDLKKLAPEFIRELRGQRIFWQTAPVPILERKLDLKILTPEYIRRLRGQRIFWQTAPVPILERKLELKTLTPPVPGVRLIRPVPVPEYKTIQMAPVPGSIAAPVSRTVLVSELERLKAEGYFTGIESYEGGIYGPVIIFPEFHDSRLLQAETALAMNRLAERCGLKRIALEGAFTGETFDSLRFAPIEARIRNGVLLDMLEIGEIKAPEFMYLLKGLSVFGIENQAEYDIRPTDSKKTNEAINYYLNKSIRIDADDRSWTLETAKIISNYRDPQQEVSRLRELKEKVERAGNVDAGIKSFYDDYLKFEDAAIKRSATMAAGVKTALEKNNGIMAMVIGDAHTRDIAEQFRKDRVNYYIARPFGLDERSVDRSSVDFKRKGEGKPVYGNDAYEKFLAGSHNTRSPFFLGWFENGLSASVLVYRALWLANASKPPAALAVPAGDRVRGAVRLDSYRRLDDGSLIMEIRNGGQRIFVRAAGGGGGAAEDIETPLAEMAVRLRDNPDSTWGQNIGDNILMVKQHDKTIVYSEDREPLEKVDIRKNVSIVQCLKDNGLMVSSEFIEYAVFLSARAGYQDLPAEKIVLMTIFRFNDPDIKERREQIEADLRKQYEEESRMRPGREDIWEKEIQLLFPLETKIRPGSRLPLAS